MTSIQQRARDLIALAEKATPASFDEIHRNDAPRIATAFLRAVELLRSFPHVPTFEWAGKAAELLKEIEK